MNKRMLRFLLVLTSITLLISCGPLSITDTVDHINNTTVPNNVTIPDTSPNSAYLDWLNQLINEYDVPYNTISPNGQMVLSHKGPYKLGNDTLVISFFDDPTRKIEILLDNSILELPPEDIIDVGKATISYPYWSPDNTAFYVTGPSYLGEPYTFLTVVDISNMEKIGISVVKWEYEGQPYISWAPDSSKILIWFGPEIPPGKMFDFTYTTKAWLVNREGNVLDTYDVNGLRSPIWVREKLYAIKNENEIWMIDTVSDTTDLQYINDNPIAKILDRSQDNELLLLIERDEPFNLLVYQIETKKIIDNIHSRIEINQDQVEDCEVIQTTSNFTGIFFVNLYIFNWTTNAIIKYEGFYSPYTWSPIVNGFIVYNYDFDRYDIINP